MRVFLDANILFSASDENSATRTLLNRVARHGQVVTSPHAWEEARRNLEAKRPHLLSGLGELKSHVSITHGFRLPDSVSVEEKDQPILGGAVGAKCTHLWTGDRTHFGIFYGKLVFGVKVVSSIMLADEIAEIV